MERHIRVAVANDYEIVVVGLAAMLDRHDDLDVVDMFIVGEDAPSEPIDVVLYDTFGRDSVDREPTEVSSYPPRWSSTSWCSRCPGLIR